MAEVPEKMTREDFTRAVKHVIRERKTAKILSNTDNCRSLSDADQVRLREILTEIIEISGWAPFHKLANEQAHCQGEMQSIVPWRYYVLEQAACCHMVSYLEQQAEAHPDSKWSRAWSSKVPGLLAGAGALVLVTWLPDPPEQGDTPEMTLNNMEHIAAASAAVQNLMLAGEAQGLHTYWASGGILREPEVFEYLRIPANQILIGAIYLAFPEIPHRENIPGSLREKRGETSDWSRWIVLD